MNISKITNHTKIVATIGPASSSVDTLVAMIKAGMTVARINLSHDPYEVQSKKIANIREAAKLCGVQVPILVDLCGPKLRIGKLKERIELKAGNQVIITTESIEGTAEKFSTSYKNLPNDVIAGDRILLDDGVIELTVKEVKDTEVITIVKQGGPLLSFKGMNLPGVNISIPAITAKDKQDLQFGIDNDVDMFALSFVRSADDIRILRSMIQNTGKHIPIIGKIEKPEAIQQVDEIIQESDAIMIARGDLGVEMNTEEVPILQKQIINKCIYYNRPVITATQMLESMVTNARPTRAEASDVANAVFDGTDAVMLSAETSLGANPVKTIEIMASIVRRAEEQKAETVKSYAKVENLESKLAHDLSKAACKIAEDSNAKAIIAITRTGRTPMLLSKFRTNRTIISFSESHKINGLLRLYWGVKCEFIESVSDTDSTIKKVTDIAINEGYITKGDVVVFIAGIPLLDSNTINMLKVDII